MASKQLGKLRQWGREVISSKEKTVLTEEFKELEHDVDLRRIGIEKLHDACHEYHGYLQSKKEYSTVEPGVKMLPVDALGAVMMSHGEAFGDDSAFGQCLLKFGRAHCKIATLQESFALMFRNTYLASLEGALSELNDYTTQRKKLDSRRLAYDAAVTKFNKTKKEKEIKEAEEELNKAKLRYEEISNDVQARMHAIRENELQQLADLTEFLATETRFAEQYLDLLRSTRDEWVEESMTRRTETARSSASPHAFAFARSATSISSTSKAVVRALTPSVPTGRASPFSDKDDSPVEVGTKPRSLPASTSRPSSRGSTTSGGTAPTRRRRYSSVGSDGVNSGVRSSVTSWASNAVSSLAGSGRGKKEAKRDRVYMRGRDKDAERGFANLDDMDHWSEDDGTRRREDNAGTNSFSPSNGSAKLSRILGERPAAPAMQPSNPPHSSSSNSSFNSLPGSGSSAPSVSRKVVRALHDFSGSEEELSFRTGDNITVLFEGKGEWSMGEASGGRRGLFPMNYTEEISAAALPSFSPPLPPTSSHLTSIAQRAQSDILSGDSASILSEDLPDVGPKVSLYDEPFGDHHLTRTLLAAEHEHEHERDPSGEATTEDEDEMRGLFALAHAPRVGLEGAPTRSASAPAMPEGGDVGGAAGGANTKLPPALPQRKQSTKRAPPPLPARRSTISVNVVPEASGVAPGCPSRSAPSSTANLVGGGGGSGSAASVAVVFPPVPPPHARTPSQVRLLTASSVAQAPYISASVSPFDN